MSFFFSCKSKNLQAEVNLDEAKIYERAISLYQQKEYPEAGVCLDTLLSINPLNGEYYFKRGYTKFMIMNDDDGAISDFLNAIKFDYYNKKSVYLNIGTIHYRNMQLDSALYFYNKSLEFDSSFEKAKNARNEVLELLNEKKRTN